MDQISFIQNIQKAGSILLLAVLVLNLVSVSQAGDPPEPEDPPGGGDDPGGAGADGATNDLRSALSNLCVMVRNVLFISAMFLVVTGAAVYAVGQILGAETRARASVWATSMFMGAIIGILVYVLVPPFLNSLLGEGTTVQC